MNIEFVELTKVAKQKANCPEGGAIVSIGNVGKGRGKMLRFTFCQTLMHKVDVKGPTKCRVLQGSGANANVFKVQLFSGGDYSITQRNPKSNFCLQIGCPIQLLSQDFCQTKVSVQAIKPEREGRPYLLLTLPGVRQ